SAATSSISLRAPPETGGAGAREDAARARSTGPARARAPAAPRPPRTARRVIMSGSLDGGRIVQTVRSFHRDLEAELGNERLDRPGLRDKRVDHVLDDPVALGIALADHLVIGLLAAVGAVLHDLHRLFRLLHGGLDGLRFVRRLL